MNPIMIGILAGFGVFAIMMIIMTIYQKKKAAKKENASHSVLPASPWGGCAVVL